MDEIQTLLQTRQIYADRMDENPGFFSLMILTINQRLSELQNAPLAPPLAQQPPPQPTAEQELIGRCSKHEITTIWSAGNDDELWFEMSVPEGRRTGMCLRNGQINQWLKTRIHNEFMFTDVLEAQYTVHFNENTEHYMLVQMLPGTTFDDYPTCEALRDFMEEVPEEHLTNSPFNQYDDYDEELRLWRDAADEDNEDLIYEVNFATKWYRVTSFTTSDDKVLCRFKDDRASGAEQWLQGIAYDPETNKLHGFTHTLDNDNDVTYGPAGRDDQKYNRVFRWCREDNGNGWEYYEEVGKMSQLLV